MIHVGDIRTEAAIPTVGPVTRFFIGRTDPSNGHIVNSVIQTGLPHLIELSPSVELATGLSCVRRIVCALGDNSIKSRAMGDLIVWIRSFASHHLQSDANQAVQTAIKFLQHPDSGQKGYPLEMAMEVFSEKYRRELSRPEAQDALDWVRAVEDAYEEVFLFDADGGLQAEIVRQTYLSLPSGDLSHSKEIQILQHAS